MNWGGIIAGAVKGGATAVGQEADRALESKAKLDLAGQLSAIDEARAKRVAEHGAGLQVDTAGKIATQAEAFDAANADARNARLKTRLGVEGEAARENAAAADAAAVESTKKKAGDKGYLDAVKTLANAQKPPESAYSAAQAALARFELENKQAILSAQKDIASGDPAKVEAAKRTLAALTPQRSSTDLVKAADVYKDLATSTRKQLESPDFLTLPEKEQEAKRAQIESTAKLYESSAASLLGEITSSRLPGLVNGAGGAAAPGARPPLESFAPGAAAPGAKPAAPGAKTTATAAPAAPAAPVDLQKRVAELRERLATDDRIKAKGEGALGRAIQEGAMPLGLAERRGMEQELKRLTTGSN